MTTRDLAAEDTSSERTKVENHGGAKGKVPRIDMSTREKLYLAFGVVIAVIAVVFGACYYVHLYKESQKNPIIAASWRELVNEEFPMDRMTAIPLLTRRVAEERCRAARNFSVAFGWDSRNSFFNLRADTKWTFFDGFWVATLDLPFAWSFDFDDGQYVTVKEPYREGKHCEFVHFHEDSNVTVMGMCPEKATVPDYGYFDELGIECHLENESIQAANLPNRFVVVPEVHSSGVFVQFHTKERDLVKELQAIEGRCGDDPAVCLLRHFRDGVFYRFDVNRGQDAWYNHLFRIKVQEWVSSNGSKMQRLNNEGFEIPLTSGTWWVKGRHYFAIAVEGSVRIITEKIQYSMVGVITAFATSLTTLSAVFFAVFKTQVSVPLHYVYGKRAPLYAWHIVRRLESDGESSDSSSLDELYESFTAFASKRQDGDIDCNDKRP